MKPSTRERWKDRDARLRHWLAHGWHEFWHGFPRGMGVGAGFALVLWLAVLVIGNDQERQQAESLRAIQRANEQVVAGVICGLGAPTRQEIQRDGTIQTLRPEPFLNRVCLIALGFEPADTDGDGNVRTGGGDGP